MANTENFRDKGTVSTPVDHRGEALTTATFHPARYRVAFLSMLTWKNCSNAVGHMKDFDEDKMQLLLHIPMDQMK